MAAGSLFHQNTFNPWLFSSTNSVKFCDLPLLWMTLHLRIKMLTEKEFHRCTSLFWEVSVIRVFFVLFFPDMNSYTQLGSPYLHVHSSVWLWLRKFERDTYSRHLYCSSKNHNRIFSILGHTLGIPPHRWPLYCKIQTGPTSWSMSIWGEAVFFLIVHCPWEIGPVNTNFLY